MAFEVQVPPGKKHASHLDSVDIFKARNVIVAIAAVVVLQYLWKFMKFRRNTRPPGPFPFWPVLGNLLLVGELPHRSFYNLAQKYGDILELKLGSTRTLLVSSPAMAKAVLKDQDHIFASRPANVFADIVLYGGKDIVFAPYGPYWRFIKKLSVVELLNARRLESFRRSRADELSRFVQGVLEQSKDGNPVNMQERIFYMAMNVVTRMLLRKRYFDREGASPPEAREFRELISETTYLSSQFNIGDFIPYLKAFDLQGYVPRLKRARKRLDMLLEKVIEEHISVAKEHREQQTTSSSKTCSSSTSPFFFSTITSKTSSSVGTKGNLFKRA